MALFLIVSCGDSEAIPAPGSNDGAPTHDVAIYLSTASRSMTFKKTGVNFDTGDLSPYTITLHPEEKYQQMDGFGAAITGSASFNLMQMAAADRAKFLKEVFDPAEGRGFSYVRVPIGCSDFSLSQYTCCDSPGIENFALTTEELDYIIPVLKEIRTYNPNLKIMGSPWTCPRWMKIMHRGKNLSPPPA
jgi:glucosylceramidase